MRRTSSVVATSASSVLQCLFVRNLGVTGARPMHVDVDAVPARLRMHLDLQISTSSEEGGSSTRDHCRRVSWFTAVMTLLIREPAKQTAIERNGDRCAYALSP